MMPTKTFKKEVLRDLVYDGANYSGLEVVSDTLEGTTRWSIHYCLIFKDCAGDDKLYEVDYSIGATEQQDEEPFEYADDDVVCTEVEAYEATVTKYRKVSP